MTARTPLFDQACEAITHALGRCGNFPRNLDVPSLISNLWDAHRGDGQTREQIVQTMHIALDHMVGLYGIVSYADNHLRYQATGRDHAELAAARLNGARIFLVWSAYNQPEANAEQIVRQCDHTALGTPGMIRDLTELLIASRCRGDSHNDGYLHYLITEGMMRANGISTRRGFPRIAPY